MEQYLIDSFEMHISVEPLLGAAENARGHDVRFGRNHCKQRWVRADNRAHVRREVKFSPDNRNRTPFGFLRYTTKNGGVISAVQVCGDNEADDGLLSRYLDAGDSYTYLFTPRPEKLRYTLEFDLYKGFDRGHRHAHFHLPKPAVMRRVALSLCLEQYIAAGFRVSQPPRLYLHTEEPDGHDFCDLRGRGRPVGPLADGPQEWKWAVGPVSGGVIDVCWDVTPPAGFVEQADVVAGPTGRPPSDGIERMGRRRLAEDQDALEVFDLVARWCEANRPDCWDFSLRGIAPHIRWEGEPLSRDSLGSKLARASDFFVDYFSRIEGRPGVARHDNHREPQTAKVIEWPHRSSKGHKFYICDPLGREAVRLVRRYLG